MTIAHISRASVPWVLPVTAYKCFSHVVTVCTCVLEFVRLVVTNKLIWLETASILTGNVPTTTDSTWRSVRVFCPARSPDISVSTNYAQTPWTTSWPPQSARRWSALHADWPRYLTPPCVNRQPRSTSGRPPRSPQWAAHRPRRRRQRPPVGGR